MAGRGRPGAVHRVPPLGVIAHGVISRPGSPGRSLSRRPPDHDPRRPRRPHRPRRHRHARPSRTQATAHTPERVRRGLPTLPDRPTRPTGLRRRPRSRVADRHRRGRRSMPSSHRRPPRHHRRPLGLNDAEAVLHLRPFVARDARRGSVPELRGGNRGRPACRFSSAVGGRERSFDAPGRPVAAARLPGVDPGTRLTGIRVLVFAESAWPLRQPLRRPCYRGSRCSSPSLAIACAPISGVRMTGSRREIKAACIQSAWMLPMRQREFHHCQKLEMIHVRRTGEPSSADSAAHEEPLGSVFAAQIPSIRLAGSRRTTRASRIEPRDDEPTD